MTKGHSFLLNSTRKPKNRGSTEEFYEYQVGGTWKGHLSNLFPKTSQSFYVGRSGGQPTYLAALCFPIFWHSMKKRAPKKLNFYFLGPQNWYPKKNSLPTIYLNHEHALSIFGIPRNLTLHRPQVTVENLGFLDQNVDTSRWQCLESSRWLLPPKKGDNISYPLRVGVVKGVVMVTTYRFFDFNIPQVSHPRFCANCIE